MKQHTGDSYNMYMDSKSPIVSENLQLYLESLTPLELAAHKARISSYMMANMIMVYDLVDQIEECEALRDSDDTEERALLPVAELSIAEQLVDIPSYGEA